jgi:two-component system chemotaxis response regulator CheY
MFSKDALILVIDDMAAARQILKAQLNGFGFMNILDADNGETAMAALQSALDAKKPVNLIISDWMMPVMSGLELLGKVRSTPGMTATPFLMVTAEGEVNQVVKALQLGVSDYVVKPFNSELLFKKLANVWAKTQPKS